METVRLRGANAPVVLLDTQKAFPSVYRSSLIRAAYNAGLVGCFLWLIIALMSDTESVIVVAGVHSTPYKVTKGLAEGRVLSAALYALFVDECLRDVHKSGHGYYLPHPTSGDGFVGALACADDVAAIPRDLDDLPGLMAVIGAFAERHMQKYGHKKTVILLFRPNQHAPSYPTEQ